MKRTIPTRLMKRFLSLFPCRGSALLTALMLISTSSMLVVQFTENQELFVVNSAGYAVIWLAQCSAHLLSTSQSLLFNGL